MTKYFISSYPIGTFTELNAADFAMSISSIFHGIRFTTVESVHFFLGQKIFRRFNPWRLDKRHDRWEDFIGFETTQIENDELRKLLINELLDIEKARYELCKQWGSALAIYLKYPTPPSEAEYDKVARKRHRYRKDEILPWTQEESFQPLIQRSLTLKERALAVEKRGETLLEDLYEGYRERRTSHNLWLHIKQSTHDLIDRSEDKSYKQALRLLNKALSQVPEGHTFAGSIHYILALRHEYEGDPNDAIESYSKAIELGEPYAPAWFKRGRLYWRKGEFALAKADFEMAISKPAKEWTGHELDYEELQTYLREP